MVAAPDCPVHKQDELVTVMLAPNGGMRACGVILLQLVCRLVGNLADRLRDEQPRYINGRRYEVLTEAIEDRLGFVTDYALKEVKTGRADYGDLLVLPKALSELPRRGSPLVTGRGNDRAPR